MKWIVYNAIDLPIINNGCAFDRDYVSLKQTSMNAMEKSTTESQRLSSKFVSPEIFGALERFIEYHPAERFSVNLRSWLLEFLMYDGSAEAEYLQDLCNDLDGMFNLLDVIALHQREIDKPVEGTE